MLKQQTTRRGFIGIGGALGLSALAPTLAACGPQGGTAGKSKNLATLAFANVGESQPQWVDLRESIHEAAKTLNVALNYYNNDGDTERTRQNAMLAVNASPKPQVICEYSQFTGLANSLSQIFDKADIPAIAVNARLGKGTHWFNLDEIRIGRDSAKCLAKAAKERGWTGHDTVVLLVNGAEFGKEVNILLGEFYFELAKQMPGLVPISSAEEVPDNPEKTRFNETLLQVDGNASLDQSFQAVSNVVGNIPSDKNVILYTIVTSSTLGAWRALERAGRSDRTLTVGLVGGEEGFKQLRTNPGWVGEADIFYGHWGQYLAAMAQAILNGTQLPDLTTSPGVILTKDFSLPDTIVAPINDYYLGTDVTKPLKLPPLEPESTGFFGTQGNAYLAETGVLQKFNNIEGLK